MRTLASLGLMEAARTGTVTQRTQRYDDDAPYFSHRFSIFDEIKESREAGKYTIINIVIQKWKRIVQYQSLTRSEAPQECG
jgi:hypothetical protein